tara:strand:- start:2291 stop:5107 length:2817 start_codon:yes stop_codon:yes gene_type:complete
MRIILLSIFLLLSCSSDKSDISANKDFFLESKNIIDKAYESFELKEYDKDATYKFGSFEYSEIEPVFYQIYDEINLILNQVDNDNRESVYKNVLNDSFEKLLNVGKVIHDPSNDYAVQYMNWYDDYLFVFDKIFAFTAYLKLPRQIISKSFYQLPEIDVKWLNLIFDEYSEVDQIIVDLNNEDTLYFSTIYYYLTLDQKEDINVSIGSLADTFNKIYRIAKSNKKNYDINFNYELEWNGFLLNSLAANKFSHTSDFKNSNFHLVKSIEYLNSIDFLNISDDYFIDGTNKKTFFLVFVHSYLYDLFFESIIQNSIYLSQNQSKVIFNQSLLNYFDKIKIFESLQAVSSKYQFSSDEKMSIEDEQSDIDILFEENIIYISRIKNYLSSNFPNFLNEELVKIGSEMGYFNYYDQSPIAHDWYYTAMQELTIIAQNYHDNSITEDIFWDQFCGVYKETLNDIFSSITIKNIQDNPETFFDHFSFLRDSINEDCSDTIINEEFRTLGLPYFESIYLHSVVLIDRINNVYSIKDDTDMLFIDYLFNDSIKEAKELANFYNNYFKLYEGNFIFSNVAESRNNTIETLNFYLITSAKDNKSNTFEIFQYQLANEDEDFQNLLYHIADFNELINFKAKIDTISKKLFNVLINPFEDSLSKEAFTLLVLDPALHNLPFEALVDKSDNFLFENHDLIRAHTLKDFIYGVNNLSESLNTREQRMDNFQRFIGVSNNKIDPKILAFGDINYSDQSKEVLNIARDNNLGLLPYTKNEISYIEKIVRQSKILSKKKASETFVKNSNLNIFSILHFATHGLSNYNNFELSSIVLSSDSNNDGLLTYKEITKLDLNSIDLVFLSACETNYARNFRNIASPSIQQAFKAAGASTVISTMWPIDDLTTSLFVEIYYSEYLKTGLSFKALQNTRKIFIETYPEYNHPYYWAAFTQFGI